MFRNSITQPNGLELVYKGEFEQDPASDYIVDVVDKQNHNAGILDDALGDLKTLQNEMNVVRFKGLLSGFLNGGTAGPVLPPADDRALGISKMYVTPITYDDTLPNLSEGAPDPSQSTDPCRSPINPYMVLYGGLEPPHLEFEDLAPVEDPCPHGDDFAPPDPDGSEPEEEEDLDGGYF